MADQKQIGPSFYDELLAYGGLVGEHFTWSDDGTIAFFEDTPEEVQQGVLAVYEAHDPEALSLTEQQGRRTELLLGAAASIAPLQDAVDVEEATEAESALLRSWKQYRVALNRLVLPLPLDAWPMVPESPA